jgi:hypothetical protein
MLNSFQIATVVTVYIGASQDGTSCSPVCGSQCCNAICCFHLPCRNVVAEGAFRSEGRFHETWLPKPTDSRGLYRSVGLSGQLLCNICNLTVEEWHLLGCYAMWLL